MSSVRRQHRASEGGQLATGGTANPSVSYDADFQFGDTLQWPSPGCPSPLFDVAIISGNGSEVVQQKRKGMIRNFFDTIIWHIRDPRADRSEEHTSELQSLMRISYAVFCLKKKKETDET